MKSMIEKDEQNKMRNDPRNYILGVFYFNLQDKRLILPKRNQWMGWTINFANPYSCLIIAAIAALVFLTEFLPKV